jgi:ubiquinone/menaquinone biosynthesis C-methylase UbiE
MLKLPFASRGDAHRLAVGMSGVKLGDRLVQVGCAHGGRLAAIAAKVGLSGQAVAVVPDDDTASRVRKGGTQAGVLIDVDVSPPTRLPLDDAAFDVAIIDDTGGLLGTMDTQDRARTIAETFRVLRAGGRVLVIASGAPSGLASLLSRTTAAPPFDPTPALQDQGYRSARTLAEREGLIFFEGLKPRV